MKTMEDSSREQSSRKRHADDPEVPDDRSVESANTAAEHKSKRAREQEMVELNFCSGNLLCCDDLEYLYSADNNGDACGTCSIFAPSDDCQKTDLCTADNRSEIVWADGFSLDEIWMNPALIYHEESDRFLENASVLSNSSSKACTSNMEKGAEEEFNEENEVHKWLLTGEDSPSYTANSLSYCTEKEPYCIGS